MITYAHTQPDRIFLCFRIVMRGTTQLIAEVMHQTNQSQTRHKSPSSTAPDDHNSDKCADVAAYATIVTAIAMLGLAMLSIRTLRGQHYTTIIAIVVITCIVPAMFVAWQRSDRQRAREGCAKWRTTSTIQLGKEKEIASMTPTVVFSMALLLDGLGRADYVRLSAPFLMSAIVTGTVVPLMVGHAVNAQSNDEHVAVAESIASCTEFFSFGFIMAAIALPFRAMLTASA